MKIILSYYFYNKFIIFILYIMWPYLSSNDIKTFEYANKIIFYKW